MYLDIPISDENYKRMRKLCDLSRDKDPGSLFANEPYSDERAAILFLVGLNFLEADLKSRGLLK